MKFPVIYDAQTKIWSNLLQNDQPKICLGQRILKKLNQSDPNKLIEVNYDNDEKLTSGQMKDLVITAAKNLLNLKIKKGDVVLFFNALNSLTTPFVFACYMIGVAICPIELCLEDDDADYVIELLNPTIIAYDPIYKNRVESTIKRINVSNLKYVLSFESTNDGKSVPQMIFKPVQSIDDFEEPNLGDPDLIVGGLILTSGTTGRPKVICLSHSQISFGVNSYWTTYSDSVVYVASSFRWITPVIFMLLPIFQESIRVFSGQIATSELCMDVIKKYKVTHFFIVVGLATNMLHYADQQQREADLSSLHYISIAGEPIPERLENLAKRLMPKCNIVKCYGMSELAGCISTSENVSKKESGSGYLYSGFSAKILSDNNNALGPNQSGRLYVKIIAPFLKYFKNDKANTEAFTDNGWFNTGDYAKFDEENVLHIFNRHKDLIKCGQHTIIPSILEKYSEVHRAVEVSHVVGFPDNSKGEIPVAFIKLSSNVSCDQKSKEGLKDDIKSFLKLTLPSNQLPPEKIYFLDKFPYTTCGKVDKVKLSKWLIDDLIN